MSIDFAKVPKPIHNERVVCIKKKARKIVLIQEMQSVPSFIAYKRLTSNGFKKKCEHTDKNLHYISSDNNILFDL